MVVDGWVDNAKRKQNIVLLQNGIFLCLKYHSKTWAKNLEDFEM